MMNNDLYMYSNGYRYSIGSIRKINEKTYTMSCGYKLRKDTFDRDAYKLTEEETKIYRGELLKNLSKSVDTLKYFRQDLQWLESALSRSSLLQVDTKALQETIDNMNNVLKDLLPNTFTINNRELTFNKYVKDLVEEVEKDV